MEGTCVTEAEQKRERSKARELRGTQWWRQQVGPGICYHCGKKFSADLLTMDHVVPIARGGKSLKRNCVPSCKVCNTQKGVRSKVDSAFEELQEELQIEVPKSES